MNSLIFKHERQQLTFLLTLLVESYPKRTWLTHTFFDSCQDLFHQPKAPYPLPSAPVIGRWPHLLLGQRPLFPPFLAAAAAKSLQSCPTLRPHRQQPTRLPCAWGSPGKNTGVGCHSLQLAKCTPCSSLLYGDYQGDLPTSQWDERDPVGLRGRLSHSSSSGKEKRPRQGKGSQETVVLWGRSCSTSRDGVVHNSIVELFTKLKPPRMEDVSILDSKEGRSLINGSPLQYSCLKNSTDWGAWQATVHGAAELDTTERLTWLIRRAREAG